MPNRRELLMSMGGALMTSTLGGRGPLRAASRSPASGVGVCIYSYHLRFRSDRSFFEPMNVLEYCHGIGAGGIQASIGTKDEKYTSTLRAKAEEYGMFVEGIAGLPVDEGDVERFEAEVVTAKEAGAGVVRVVVTPGAGRRFEEFDTCAGFNEAWKTGRERLERGARVAERHRVRLAVENHKDARIDGMLEALRSVGSEFVGMCLDMGNSLSLLEDPMDVIEAYAPYTFSVHLKDVAVREDEDGFLMAQVPLGDGMIDLSRTVKTIAAHRPEAKYSLEIMTRDPIRVPCLTEKYLASLCEVPANDLARTLRMVRAWGRKEPLPQISTLEQSEQLRLEDENVKKSLAYAGEHLGL
ncbi:MAG: TIM barrel protein [Acidobacteriota bacterium]|jgi:sugar phosphate isomerase/epimerase